jgi:hypothetical protein
MMTDLLSKPDAAHQRQLAMERKARVVMRSVWTLYVVAGVLTFAFRLWLLSSQCGAIVQCGSGVVKALAWTVFWPFYWMFYTNGAA